jgi:two-component system, NarL family, nitrate/nitrite response regulator NarL
MEAVIRIGAIDDDQMLLHGMASWIAAEINDIELTVIAASVSEYLSQTPLPEIVLLDLNLDNFTDPVDNVTQLVEAGLKVIVMSVIPDPAYIASTTEAGAETYITKKNNNLNALARAVRDVHEGNDATTPEQAFWLSRDNRPHRPDLSPRELQVLIAFGEGKTQDAIARRLGIAPSTVQTHLERVRTKYLKAGRPIENRGHYSDRVREDRFGRERLGPP